LPSATAQVAQRGCAGCRSTCGAGCTARDVDDRTVRVINGNEVIAEHPRSWGRRQIFEKPEHRAALLGERRAARNLKGRDRIRAVVPAFERIVERWGVAVTDARECKDALRRRSFKIVCDETKRALDVTCTLGTVR